VEKIVKKKKVEEVVEKEITVYRTLDGKEYREEKSAIEHEDLLKKYPKICAKDIDWIEEFVCDKWGEDDVNNFFEALESKSVLILTNAIGCDFRFDVVDPILAGVLAVVNVLDRREIGMNCDLSVSGIIYLKESFICTGWVREGRRNIDEVLQ
jgi:hypothetical protein